jgi:hypothetical protein
LNSSRCNLWGSQVCVSLSTGVLRCALLCVVVIGAPVRRPLHRMHASPLSSTTPDVANCLQSRLQDKM